MLDQAIHPPGTPNAEYPRWLYRNGNVDGSRLVQDAAEEDRLRAEDYVRELRPPDYTPKWMIQNPGVWNCRGVLLHNESEETRWRAAVNEEDWINDDAHLWGARGMSLAAIEEERKEVLKSMIDADALEFVGPESYDEVEPEPIDSGADTANAESATEETSKES